MTDTTTYEPGRMYAVTSWRGEKLPAFRTLRGNELSWCVLQGLDTRGLDDDEVTDVDRLVVLDICNADNYVDALRATGRAGLVRELADQIEASYRTRIPEPSLWGVVEAEWCGGTRGLPRAEWVRVKGNEWKSCISNVVAAWGDLINPTEVRPGIEETS